MDHSAGIAARESAFEAALSGLRVGGVGAGAHGASAGQSEDGANRARGARADRGLRRAGADVGSVGVGAAPREIPHGRARVRGPVEAAQRAPARRSVGADGVARRADGLEHPLGVRSELRRRVRDLRLAGRDVARDIRRPRSDMAARRGLADRLFARAAGELALGLAGAVVPVRLWVRCSPHTRSAAAC